MPTKKTAATTATKATKTAATATPKTMVRVKPYTHTVELPELGAGVKLPANYEPAYFRARKTLAVLRAADKTHYLVFNTSNGKSIQVANTKQASKTMSAIRRGELQFS